MKNRQSDGGKISSRLGNASPLSKGKSKKQEDAPKVETVATSIVGPYGRFIIPLEPWLTVAFYKACRHRGEEPSQVLAEVCHERLLEVSAQLKRKGSRK